MKGPFDPPVGSSLTPVLPEKPTADAEKSFAYDNYARFVERTREEAVWDRQDYFRFMKVLKN